MGLSDAEVMARIADDPQLFVHVFDRHGAAVHAFLARRAGRQAADDLLGEVWVQALRSASSFDGRTPDARPWLYGIARNTLRAHWRSRARDAQLGVGCPRSADLWSDVDDQLDAAGHRPELLAALRSLAVQDRDVLLLVVWEGLSPTEVAVALDVPAGTVRWRLHRARRSIRHQLGESPLGAAECETSRGVLYGRH